MVLDHAYTSQMEERDGKPKASRASQIPKPVRNDSRSLHFSDIAFSNHPEPICLARRVFQDLTHYRG